MAQQQRKRPPAGQASARPRQSQGARQSSQRQGQGRTVPAAVAAEQLRRNAEITGILLIAAGLFFLLTYMKFSGVLGESVSGFVFGLAGIFAYAFPVVLICCGVFSIAQAGAAGSSQKSLLALGLSLCVCALLHVSESGSSTSDSFMEFIVRAFDTGESLRRGGGLFGGILAYPSARYMGAGGTYLLYGTLVLVQIVVLTNISLKTAGERAAGFLRENAQDISERMSEQMQHQRERREEQNARRMAEREAREQAELEQMRLMTQNAHKRSDVIEPPKQKYKRYQGICLDDPQEKRPAQTLVDGLEELSAQTANEPRYDYRYDAPLPEGTLPPSRFSAFAPPLKTQTAVCEPTAEFFEPVQEKSAIIEETREFPAKKERDAEHDAECESEYLGMGIFYPPKPRAAFKSVEIKAPEDASDKAEIEELSGEQLKTNAADNEPHTEAVNEVPPELYAGEYEKFLPPVNFTGEGLRTRGLGYPPRGVPTMPEPAREMSDDSIYQAQEEAFVEQTPESVITEPPDAHKLEMPQTAEPEPPSFEEEAPELPPNVVQFEAKPQVQVQAAANEKPTDGKKQHMDRYASPSVDVLHAAKYEPPAEDLPQKATLLEETLATFGVSAKVINVTQGPVITRYELQPAPGVRVNRITNLSDDLALALAAPRVRIEAPIPGKAAIGIEVPNKHTTPVMLREIVQSREFREQKSKLAVCLGKDIAGKPVVADLAKMPHLLIAGSTGSGKSVCINCIICSIVYHAMPDEVRLIMVDPKVVELAAFDNLPHLLIPVVTEAKHAANALKWGVNEMVKRYNNFATVGARDLHRYNEITMAQGAKRTPQILVIIDELADLMMVAPDDVEDAICRIAQMGRAAGIHLVVATQRPSADVITGLIKANIPSRIAFAVASSMDSRIILDAAGADKLLGKGDMLFSPLGSGKPSRVQGAFVSDEEVEQIHDYFSKYDFSVDTLDEQELDDIESGNIAAPGGDDGDDEELYGDELLPKAVEILMASGTASISMLQRRLRIGYARAARLIDIMEQYGVVSGYDGSKARKLLIDRAGYERMFGHPPNIADLGT